MDIAQILNLVTGTPMIAVLLYLLVKEQAAHAETRRQADMDRRDYMIKYSDMAAKSLVALEAVDDALRDIRDIGKQLYALTEKAKS